MSAPGMPVELCSWNSRCRSAGRRTEVEVTISFIDRGERAEPEMMCDGGTPVQAAIDSGQMEFPSPWARATS